jgi:Mg-chelatase subunit ChlD
MVMFLTAPIQANGQDTADSVAPVDSPIMPAVSPIQVVAPTQETQPFSRVMYILDVSGSMRGELPEAIRAVDIFMTDGFQAAVVTFNETHARWTGVNEPCRHGPERKCDQKCLPPGWCWMPKHRIELFQHLSSFAGSGNTMPQSAIEYAYQKAPSECLIVFISDGGFDTEAAVKAARDGAAWRAAQQLEPTPLLVWSTVYNAGEMSSLVELARVGGAGLWRAETPRDREPPTAQGAQ